MKITVDRIGGELHLPFGSYQITRLPDRGPVTGAQLASEDPAPFWSSPAHIPVAAANGWMKCGECENDLDKICGLDRLGIMLRGGRIAWDALPHWHWSPTHLGPWKECRREGGAK